MSILSFFHNLKVKHYTKNIQKTVKECGVNLRVNGPSLATSNTYLGNNVNFNGIHIQGKGEVKIGDNFHSGIECMILTDNHNYDNGEAIPYDETIISKNVTIEDNVWLGNRVNILPGVTIHEGAIIQLGSVVVRDVPKCAIVGGNPATVFKYRDKDHYEKLKSQAKFH